MSSDGGATVYWYYLPVGAANPGEELSGTISAASMTEARTRVCDRHGLPQLPNGAMIVKWQDPERLRATVEYCRGNAVSGQDAPERMSGAAPTTLVWRDEQGRLKVMRPRNIRAI